MRRSVVSNAGPLIVLAKLNLLHLLKQLYGRVYFPPSVYKETVTEGLRLGLEDARALDLFLKQQKWEATEAKSVSDELASLHLDQGEQESLSLALAMNALFLIDEERGREEARRFEVEVRGTLGVLVEAHQHTLIGTDQLRFYLSQIEKRTDIWISPALCRRLLKEVSEEG